MPLIDRTNTSGLFTLPGAGIHLLLSVLIVAIVWYPATHAAKWLVDDIEMAKTWYIFWVFPAAFFLLNRPDPSALLRDALHEPGHEVLSDFNSGASDIPPALLFYVLPDGIGDEPEHETFEGK